MPEFYAYSDLLAFQPSPTRFEAVADHATHKGHRVPVLAPLGHRVESGAPQTLMISEMSSVVKPRFSAYPQGTNYSPLSKTGWSLSSTSLMARVATPITGTSGSMGLLAEISLDPHFGRKTTHPTRSA